MGIGLLVTLGTVMVLGELVDTRVPSALFDLDAESSLPTTFSILLWVGASAAFLALAVLARPAKATARAYAAFAAVFAYFAFDEGSMIHEQLNPLVEGLAGGAEVPTYYWVPAGALMVVAVGILLLRLVRRLPAVMRRRLIVAGVVFLLGALVVESLGAPFHPIDATGLGEASDDALPRPVYTLLVGLEEGLEMAGGLLAVRAGLLGLALRREGRSLVLQAASTDDDVVVDLTADRSGARA